MKKTIIVFVFIFALFYWVNANKNDFAVWTNSDSFYRPIVVGKINLLQAKSAVRIELEPNYSVQHGFFLTFPCETLPVELLDNLDGSIRYTFSRKGVELESREIQPPSRPISILTTKGCKVALFVFDLPFQGHEVVTLEVAVESPIMKLAQLKDIHFEVSPAYWPK